MAELLLEIRSEEIPARMQAGATEDLIRLVSEGLGQYGISDFAAQSFVTPRRLTLRLTQLPLHTADQQLEKRGPRVDAPQAAMDGFLKSNHLTLEQCLQKTTEKGDFWFAQTFEKGRALSHILKPLIENILAHFPWPKSMRWGSQSSLWVRPIKSILCLFNEQVIPLEFAGVSAGNQTVGHRFLSPAPVSVINFNEYKLKLRGAWVMLDPGERRQAIESQAIACATALKLEPVFDEALLGEITGLVEFPVVLCGNIEPRFMSLPPEVLVTSMKTHQKYISLRDHSGAAAPYFLVVANLQAQQGEDAIIRGNERVLRARLEDAAFFWQNDINHSLVTFRGRLKTRLFYGSLGSMWDKSERLAALSCEIRKILYPDQEPLDDSLKIGGECAKADLMSEMVGEFPELQGIMGGYYAQKSGFNQDVATAIAEHYLPKGVGDTLPTTPCAICLSLADKLDTLVGFFSINEKPTGSKDPFALRRAALGVIRIVIEHRLSISLQEVIFDACRFYKDFNGSVVPMPEQVYNDLYAFFIERFKTYLRESKQIAFDVVDAILATKSDHLYDLYNRAEALGQFIKTPDGAHLQQAYKRANNILDETLVNRHLLSLILNDKGDFSGWDQAELDFKNALATTNVKVGKAMTMEHIDYQTVYSDLAALREATDQFFTRIKVNADEPDIKQQRHTILCALVDVMDKVADFSQIEG